MDYESLSAMYADANYFVTTTMTSVGYGDLSARVLVGIYSTIGVMITQFFGLLGFSIVKEQVFSSKHLITIVELVKKAEDDIEETLFRIDKLRDSVITNDMYDQAIESIAVQEEYSICRSFREHKFWHGLSPQLQ